MKPLAAKQRPEKLTDYVGQSHILGQDKPLTRLIKSAHITSMIFWGPPGCGKTSLARIIAHETQHEFFELSAVNASKADVERILNQSRLTQQTPILFLDEIHRFNKAQQDFLLPHVESGRITLIGATTENPSFEVNAALLSRCRVFVLYPLTCEDICAILSRAKPDLDKNIQEHIANYADGDARRALNILENALLTQEPITEALLTNILQHKHLRYDKKGEEHYNIISALHKSMRDSDPQGAVYWTMRMIEAGEDLMYIARRMICFASEDIGLADPQALLQAVATKEAVHMLGYPEANTALVQCAIYLATAPKSNAVYVAVNRAKADIQATGSLPVPLIMRNAPTQLMKELGYGKDYKYAPDYAHVEQQHLPDELKERIYFERKT